MRAGMLSVIHACFYMVADDRRWGPGIQFCQGTRKCSVLNRF